MEEVTDDLRICTTCDGSGQERREITHPMANVATWHRVRGNTYVRKCQRCNGEGFVPAGTSVPVVTMAKEGT